MQDMSNAEHTQEPYILVAPNGARRGKGDHAALPVTTEQITATARQCHDAGAHGLHLHVRDRNGQHSLDSGRYREAIDALASEVSGMDVQITTESADLFDVAEQLECLRQVRPRWASISVREIARSPDLAERVYALCAEQGTRVQHILYDANDAALLERWQEDGTVRPGQDDRLLVLGRYAVQQQSVPQDIDLFPVPASRWMVCAFGSREHACLQEAVRRGGDVRVGFENSMTNASGDTWANNAASVRALVALIKGTVK